MQPGEDAHRTGANAALINIYAEYSTVCAYYLNSIATLLQHNRHSTGFSGIELTLMTPIIGSPFRYYKRDNIGRQCLLSSYYLPDAIGLLGKS